MSDYMVSMNGPEREEIEYLIPWYVMGKLDGPDHARVERYLELHPELRRLVDLASEEADGTFSVNEAIAVSGLAGLDRLKAEIKSTPRRRAVHAIDAFWASFLDWIAGLRPQTLVLAGAVATLLLVIQAGTLTTLLIDRHISGPYQTATGPSTESTQGTFALVSFAPGASIAEVSALMTEIGAVIVEGPKADGVFRVCISKTSDDAAAAAAALAKLKAHTELVSFASLTK
jgi:hypothetical protein